MFQIILNLCFTQILTTQNSELTQDVHHREAIIESKADEKATQAELPEVRDKSRGYTGDEANQITTSQSWNSAVAISNPSEQKTSADCTDEEDCLRNSGQEGIIANPVQLRIIGIATSLVIKIIDLLLTSVATVAYGISVKLYSHPYWQL